MPAILLIEDEEPIREMLHFAFTTAGFTLFEAETGAMGLSLLEKQHVDLILLDWMLPDQSGIEVTKAIRNRAKLQHLPIIMLTARAEEADKVRALSLGADDYVVKPFSPLELIARIQAVLRRMRTSTSTMLVYQSLELDLTEHQARCQGKALTLTALEFKLLAHFCKHPKQVFSRDQLLNAVWGYNGYVGERTVDSHVKRLRKVLKDANMNNIIHTKRGIGYYLI